MVLAAKRTIDPGIAKQCVLAAALAYLGVVEEGGDNRGQMVELMLRDVALKPGDAWCVAYIYRTGHYALLNPTTNKSSWPLPATGSCWVLGDFARRNGLLVTEPQPGDVFLIYNNDPKFKRFSHAGFVIDVLKDGSCLCIEGNTNNDGSRNGNAVLVRTRKFRTSGVAGKDRFIRWTRLLDKGA